MIANYNLGTYKGRERIDTIEFYYEFYDIIRMWWHGGFIFKNLWLGWWRKSFRGGEQPYVRIKMFLPSNKYPGVPFNAGELTEKQALRLWYYIYSGPHFAGYVESIEYGGVEKLGFAKGVGNVTAS